MMFFIIIFFFTELLYASDIHDSSLGLFSLTSFPNTWQKAESGGTEKFNFNPGIKFDLFHNLPKNFLFQLTGGFTIPHSGKDKNITKIEALMAYQIGYHFKGARLLLGPALFWSSISAKKKTQELPNGTGTSTFYMPPERHIAVNSPLSLELSYTALETYRTAFQYLLFNPFSSTKRNYAYLISINYHFGEINL